MTRLKSLVILLNDKMKDMGDVLAVARSTAQKKEHTHRNMNVKALHFIPELDCYVALYEVQSEAGVSLRKAKLEWKKT